MSILEQIQNSNSEEEIIRLIEEHVLDEESSLSWLEMAEVYEKQGKDEEANTLRTAHQRYSELDSTD
ncbi:MAG: hypothetical protein KZQ64_06075 [gamma proteobacterium symbiont of Bathyaustriella thionipta]|nr:hypothetical protein [gamma proteobacterium symbiont of Bathyaustriella thionipta]MCU7949568.1 hypothetical protein [gamma proteobacterium symbiont of Bathyaustriella thionipta]MCU7952944.1 hypothetical protein [gamma proteobacterium symbiont of Bathyaustriella thionipta]MCU7956160.1 hypothetical protein [gamma proteobacterium symbiont of Bathyaustriella thionipta]MCU7966686.1 hypothetical protein [gamma proteobacterium symbiont of Bathyaustriella thionipta]